MQMAGVKSLNLEIMKWNPTFYLKPKKTAGKIDGLADLNNDMEALLFST
jgi:hypothetical protein